MGCLRLTEVEQVRDGVSDAVDEDEHSSQLVEVDVLVEWQEAAEPPRPQESDAMPQHQHQHKHAVEVETLTYRTISFTTDFLLYYIINNMLNRKKRWPHQVIILDPTSENSVRKIFEYTQNY